METKTMNLTETKIMNNDNTSDNTSDDNSNSGSERCISLKDSSSDECIPLQGDDSEECIPYRMDPAHKQKMINELNSLIDRFIDQFKHFPKQKSAEWLKLRTNGMGGVYIGGSDIATAIDVNDYQSPGQLIRSKCGLKTSRDNSDPIAMHWGSLFEDVIARYLEIDFKTTIKGTEMIICGHKLYRYSPDGFIVACIKMTDCGIKIVPLDDPEGIPVIILCEIKSLWARMSKDTIPKYYVPQPLAGLEVSSIAYMALYVEGLFKVCNLDELGPNKNYSKLIHTRQRFLNMWPIAWGMFSVYCTKEKEYDEFAKSYKTTDIGKCDLDSFKQIMKKIDSGVYTTEFTDPKPYTREAIDKLYSDAENCDDDRYFLGVIPWKLFDIAYFQMERDPEYIPSISKDLETVNSLISRAKEVSDSQKEEFIVKEMQKLNINDEERGIMESPKSGRTADEQNFLNSL